MLAILQARAGMDRSITRAAQALAQAESLASPDLPALCRAVTGYLSFADALVQDARGKVWTVGPHVQPSKALALCNSLSTRAC
jgi:DNA-directed RNA polymerase specialized sigma24 family protein